MAKEYRTLRTRSYTGGLPTGVDLLHDPVLNKGMAFSEEERDALHLRGLLPPRVHSQDDQLMRVLENVRGKSTDLEKYIFLTGLQERNLILFCRLVTENIEELMPIIYTPTVGQACQEYGHIFRRPQGLYISAHDRGRVSEILRNWPYEDIRVVAISDGERILGLGDLGAYSMGILVGKLTLYMACAGIHPSLCLPVAFDVGTNNEVLLNDPLYIGLKQRRLRGDAYHELIEEFVMAVQHIFPDALIHLEDFGTANAFQLLKDYRNRACLFDDDIQGTAAVALAGIYSALRITKGRLRDQTFLFLGAGEAGIGIGELIVAAALEEGLSEEEARRRCWFVDSKGLIVRGRTGLTEDKQLFAHEHEFLPDFPSAIERLRPTGIIGVSGKPGMFTRLVIEAMARFNDRPVILALSNPTSLAECTAEEAYMWTNGRAIFASGSPFDPVWVNGKQYSTSQGNNAYIFPGVGLGLISCGVKFATDEMFLVAARALAHEVSDTDLEKGLLYPPFSRVRDVSAVIAAAVANVAYQRGLARKPMPEDLLTSIRSQIFEARYQNYV